MRALEINLAADPYRNDTPLVALLVTLALAAFGLSGWGAFVYATASSERARLEQDLADHDRHMAEMKQEADALTAALAKVDHETLSSQASFVAGILEQRNFSWTTLFNVLERTVPWDVRLTSVRPVFRSGTVEIELTGTAQDLDALLDFQERLLDSPHFEGVLPGNYERSEADERIDFSLAVTYLPDTVEKGETVPLAAAEDGVAGDGDAADAAEDEGATAAEELAEGDEPGRGARTGAAARAPGPAARTRPGQGAAGRARP